MASIEFIRAPLNSNFAARKWDLSMYLYAVHCGRVALTGLCGHFRIYEAVVSWWDIRN